MSLSSSCVSSTLRATVIFTLVAFMVLLAVRPVQAASTCAPFASITMGKYWLNNNLWGKGSGSGWQCMWDASNSPTDGTIGWGTNWSWTGQPNSVKSYSSAVLGWHWGGNMANTGLPLQVSSRKNVYSHWTYRLEQHSPGTLNVAYDLWLHASSHPGSNEAPSDEVMLWLSHSNTVHPVGTKRATITIEGASWDLYEGPLNWQVHTFVRTTSTSSSSLNLKAFLNVLVARKSLSNARYLNGVEIGSEVFTGSAQLDTLSYNTNIQ